jgi:Uma2 family endonuclease
MAAASSARNLISPEECVTSELVAPVQHEYVGGVVHAMTGARNIRNTIAGKIFGALPSRLRGKKCRPFHSDTQVRPRLPSQGRFYYPDVQVVCAPNPPGDSFQDHPNVIVEVLSGSTRRTDEGETLDGYTAIPSLETYVLADSMNKEVVVYHRGETGFVRSVCAGTDGSIPLPCLGFELLLAEICEDVQLPAFEAVG